MVGHSFTGQSGVENFTLLNGATNVALFTTPLALVVQLVPLGVLESRGRCDPHAIGLGR